mgnify:CR=1 FL=1
MDIQELLTRGVEKVFPSAEAAAKMLGAGKPLRIYLGIDPTGSELHLGHSVQILFLRRLLEAGHQPILLIGDFTARIGDPSDKDATRKQLSSDETKRNMATYLKQLSPILPLDRIEVRYNSEWFEPMPLQQFEEIKSVVTVQQLVARDMFQKRMADGKPISAQELDYPIFQGYDTVAMDADGEVGGNDQTFNMLMGRDMLKHFKNKEKIVFATKLLADPATGKKMSKTEGTLVALTDDPKAMFGGVMAFSDGMIASAFEMITDAPMEKVAEVSKRLASGENPKILKEELAEYIVSMYYGPKPSEEAREEFKNVFSKGETPREMPEHAAGILADVLVDAKLVASKSEVIRLVKQHGITVNGKTAEGGRDAVSAGDVIKIGARRFLKIS